MREIAIIIIILIAIISIGNLTQKHLIDTSDDLNTKLEELKTELDYMISNNGDIQVGNKAKKLSEELKTEWEDLEKTWSIIVMHTELDQIELSMLELKGCIEVEDWKTGREEIERTMFLVGHIKEKEAFKLKNVF